METKTEAENVENSASQLASRLTLSELHLELTEDLGSLVHMVLVMQTWTILD